MHLYQDKPLEDQYGLLNLYKQREGNVVVTDKDNLPKDSPPLFLEKMIQLKITGYVALGLFANKEDVYPRAIISCVLDEEAKRDGLDVELYAQRQTKSLSAIWIKAMISSITILRLLNSKWTWFALLITIIVVLFTIKL